MGGLGKCGRSTGSGRRGGKLNSAILADQVYDRILIWIFNRQLRPGDRLDRKLIANELEDSLIPVSDAVQRLAHPELVPISESD